jgi:G3E family GTPase
MADSSGRIPAAVLTGFLGSGKTTILNRLVRDPSMENALVVINELGEIGLDHELVERTSGDVLLLRSGCLCCTLRSDLVETLEAATARARSGDMPAFDRVVVETTGLAEPEPIAQAFLADDWLARAFELRRIAVTVDAVLGRTTIERHPEAVKQVAMADLILITKADLCDENAVRDLEARLRALNAMARIDVSRPEWALDASILWKANASPFAWGAADAHTLPEMDGSTHDHAGDTADGSAPVAGVRVLHNGHIRTYSFVRGEPIPAETIDRWLTSFLDLSGPDLLRFKAIVNVAGLPGPLVLQGVQHVLHPPLACRAWPSADRRTRMVFITYDAQDEDIRRSLAALEEA